MYEKQTSGVVLPWRGLKGKVLIISSVFKIPDTSTDEWQTTNTEQTKKYKTISVGVLRSCQLGSQWLHEWTDLMSVQWTIPIEMPNKLLRSSHEYPGFRSTLMELKGNLVLWWAFGDVIVQSAWLVFDWMFSACLNIWGSCQMFKEPGTKRKDVLINTLVGSCERGIFLL